jgi:hypothetical protein
MRAPVFPQHGRPGRAPAPTARPPPQANAETIAPLFVTSLPAKSGDLVKQLSLVHTMVLLATGIRESVFGSKGMVCHPGRGWSGCVAVLTAARVSCTQVRPLASERQQRCG